MKRTSEKIEAETTWGHAQSQHRLALDRGGPHNWEDFPFTGGLDSTGTHGIQYAFKATTGVGVG